MGFAAVNTGNNLLFLIVSALLGFMAVSGIAGWLNIRQLDVRLEKPEEIYAGCETRLAVRIRNRKRWLPSFLIRLKLAGGEETFPVLGRGGEARGSLSVRFDKRGKVHLTGAEVCSSYPINFFVRCRGVTLEESVLVFPFPRACGISVPSGREGKGGAAPAAAKGFEGDIVRISGYTGSEPLKSIHWRLTARHDELKVKELSAFVAEPVVIDPSEMSSQGLEERLSCCAFIVNKFIRDGRPVGLKLPSRVIPPAATNGHRLMLLMALATYDQDHNSP